MYVTVIKYTKHGTDPITLVESPNGSRYVHRFFAFLSSITWPSFPDGFGIPILFRLQKFLRIATRE